MSPSELLLKERSNVLHYAPPRAQYHAQQQPISNVPPHTQPQYYAYAHSHSQPNPNQPHPHAPCFNQINTFSEVFS